MIIKASIKNFMGVEDEISINCLANNKIKRKNKPYVSTDDGVNVLKNIGIIGSNGSGKTSILNAIATIQTFINFPFRKSKNNNKNFIEQIKNLPKEMLEQILDDFNNLNLPTANINHEFEDTCISLELYIPNNESNIGGYYNYSLLYDYNYKTNGIKEEKLTYRKKYNSKKSTVIFCVNNIIESELGTTLLYKNNNMNVENENIKYYVSVGEEITKKMDFVFFGDAINLNSFYNSHKLIFDKLCNLADDKIVKTSIEKEDNKDIIVFLNKNNKKLYFEQLSVGTQKIIVLGCKIINSIENNRTVFVDEIEISLHPSLANFLVLIIQKLKKQSFNQLFFTTHSINLAMLLDNDQLYYIDNKNDNYNFLNICDAIKQNIITKDKTLQKALTDNLLINNPDLTKIDDFVSNIN